jgi:uncharacterized membrane protein YkvA (DUF1232 family)
MSENIYNTEGQFTEKEKKFLGKLVPEQEYTDVETQKLIAEVETKTDDKRTFRLIKYLKALRRYLTDSNVQWYKKSIVIGALIYFVSPIDTIPDIAPILGYLDDLGVITWTLKFLGDELKTYI